MCDTRPSTIRRKLLTALRRELDKDPKLTLFDEEYRMWSFQLSYIPIIARIKPKQGVMKVSTEIYRINDNRSNDEIALVFDQISSSFAAKDRKVKIKYGHDGILMAQYMPLTFLEEENFGSFSDFFHNFVVRRSWARSIVMDAQTICIRNRRANIASRPSGRSQQQPQKNKSVGSVGILWRMTTKGTPRGTDSEDTDAQTEAMSCSESDCSSVGSSGSFDS